MPRVRAWFCRSLGLLSRRRRDAEMSEEIQQHVNLLAERNIAAGMSASEALENSVRNEIRAVDPAVPASYVRTMEQALGSALPSVVLV